MNHRYTRINTDVIQLLVFVVLQKQMAVREKQKEPQDQNEPQIYTDEHRLYLVVGVVVLQKQMAVREKQKEPQDQNKPQIYTDDHRCYLVVGVCGITKAEL